jgi:hypothetical protein
VTVACSTDLLGFSPFTIYVIPTHIWDLAICPDFLVDFGTDTSFCYPLRFQKLILG